MTVKDDQVYVTHMLECIEKIEDYTGDDEYAFCQSTLIQDAVIRNLQILAESSQRLSQTLKDNYPQIPWREVSGFRNVLVHDYLGIDLDTIWSVVAVELPTIKKALLQMQKP